jgi:hypothetical protein
MYVPRSFCVLAEKGGLPASISKQRAPRDHLVYCAVEQ